MGADMWLVWTLSTGTQLPIEEPLARCVRTGLCEGRGGVVRSSYTIVVGESSTTRRSRVCGCIGLPVLLNEPLLPSYTHSIQVSCLWRAVHVACTRCRPPD